MKSFNVKSGYVLSKGHSGMGNRLLSLLSATLYARLSGRQLIIDWRDGGYSDFNINSFSAFFTSSSAKYEDIIPETYSIWPVYWRGRLHQFLPDLVRASDPKFRYDFKSTLVYSASQRRIDYPDEVVVVCGYRDHISSMRPNLLGDWEVFRHLSRKHILRQIWNTEYGWSSAVNERVQAVISRTWTEKMVGVHVRQTDLRIPLQRYYRYLDRLWETVPGATMFVATDGENIIEQLTKRYGRVVFLEKNLSIRSCHGSLHGSQGNRLQHGIDAVVDMRLLSLCNHLVYSSRSTFGYISDIWMKQDGCPMDIDRWNPSVVGRHLLQDVFTWREDYRQKTYHRRNLVSSMAPGA